MVVLLSKRGRCQLWVNGRFKQIIQHFLYLFADSINPEISQSKALFNLLENVHYSQKHHEGVSIADDYAFLEVFGITSQVIED